MRIGSGDFLVEDLANWGSKVFIFVRISLYVWAMLEASACWLKLRKRVALGLAEPLAAAQIFCWAMAALFSIGIVLIIGWNKYHLHQSSLDDPASIGSLLLCTLASTGLLWCAFVPPKAMCRRFPSEAV